MLSFCPVYRTVGLSFGFVVILIIEVQCIVFERLFLLTLSTVSVWNRKFGQTSVSYNESLNHLKMYASVSIWKDSGSYFLSGFRDLEQNICEVVTHVRYISLLSHLNFLRSWFNAWSHKMKRFSEMTF